MAYATIDDLVSRAGDMFLNDTDRATAQTLIDDASAIIEKRFADVCRPVEIADSQLLTHVVCFMVLRAMDSFKKSEEPDYGVYGADQYASTSYFNYRGRLKPSADELEMLGLPRKNSRIGTVGAAWL